MFNKTLILAAGLALSGATLAGDSQFNYRLGVAVGHDSNPLEVSGDGPNGAYTQLRADGFFQSSLGPKAKLFVGADGGWRFFESTTSNADYGYGELRGGVALRPTRFGGDRLAIYAGAKASMRRATYTDRADGRVYEVPTLADPLVTVQIPDRFDYDVLGVFFNTRYTITERVRVFVESRLDQVHYTEDYERIADVDPIDYRSLDLEPGVAVKINESLTATFSLSWVDVDYEARPALDASGSEVPGSAREYRYLGYQLRLGFKPTDRWSLRFGFGQDFRDDTYAGFYDTASQATYVSAKRSIGETGNIRFYTSLTGLDYDRASVFGDPNGERRGSDVRRFVSTYDRSVGRGLRWFVEGGVQRTDNNDPVFKYDRDWVLTGVNFRR